MSASQRIRNAARITLHTLVAVSASLALAGVAQAQGAGHGGFHGGGGAHAGAGWHRGGPGWRGGRGGWGWGGVGLGLGVGLGVGLAGYYGWPYGAYGPYGPYGVYDGTYVNGQPDGVVAVPPAGGTVPPQVYPRNGQSAAQTDADGNVCSQWAGQQPNATTDPRNFYSAFASCMNGRGYTVQ